MVLGLDPLSDLREFLETKGSWESSQGMCVAVAAIFVILFYRADSYAGEHDFGILPLVY